MHLSYLTPARVILKEGRFGASRVLQCSLDSGGWRGPSRLYVLHQIKGSLVGGEQERDSSPFVSRYHSMGVVQQQIGKSTPDVLQYCKRKVLFSLFWPSFEASSIIVLFTCCNLWGLR